MRAVVLVVGFVLLLAATRGQVLVVLWPVAAWVWQADPVVVSLLAGVVLAPVAALVMQVIDREGDGTPAGGALVVTSAPPPGRPVEVPIGSFDGRRWAA